MPLALNCFGGLSKEIVNRFDIYFTTSGGVDTRDGRQAAGPEASTNAVSGHCTKSKFKAKPGQSKPSHKPAKHAKQLQHDGATTAAAAERQKYRKRGRPSE